MKRASLDTRDRLNPNDMGRCWDCGYQLRGVESRRCPECGRPFDPADSLSTCRRRPRGWPGNWFLTTPGWPTVALAAAGAVGVAWGTGWPTELVPRCEDAALLVQWLGHRRIWSATTGRWDCYASGTILATIAFLWLVLRMAARRLVAWHYRTPSDLRLHRSKIFATVTILFLGTMLMMAIGGESRIGREWAHAELMAAPPSLATVRIPILGILSPERQLQVIRTLILHGDDPLLRRTGVKLLVEHFAAEGRLILQDAAMRERDTDVLAAELCLVGLYRNLNSVPFVEHFVEDQRKQVRCAAMDALGIIYQPAYRIHTDPTTWFPPPEIAGSPCVDVSAIIALNRRTNNSGNSEFLTDYPFYAVHTPMPMERRNAIERIVLEAKILDEREAAARSILLQPPKGFRLRVAEWGVWLEDSGDLKMAKAVVDEVPSFVHRTGNPLAELRDRIQEMMFVDKPVIYVTVDEPMAVDVEVRIRDGRPWFAYPMPDDFEVEVESIHSYSSTQPVVPDLLKALDKPSLGTLRVSTLRSGYPWMLPAHRSSGGGGGRGGVNNDITEVGVHWQSLIVSPAKLPWMKEPSVGDESRYAWWQRQRRVDCSWLSNRGESERFLYYDGPTLMRMPRRVTLKDGALHFVQNLPKPLDEAAGFGSLEQRRGAYAEANAVSRWMMFVQVRGGQAIGEIVPGLVAEFRPFQFPELELHQDQLERRLNQMLLERGLRDSEAAGLLDCWREMFFKKDGARLLTLLTADDYDSFCPMVVHPAPTQRVRVGIVLAELGPR